MITLLEPRDEDAIVECRLEHVSLTSLLKYKALSYCWGDATDTKEIIVNDCAIRITANLEEALRRLRLSESGSFIWIDALCIDQMNIDERDWQVLRMRDIYRQAEIVIAWLGEEIPTKRDIVAPRTAIPFLEAVAHG